MAEHPPTPPRRRVQNYRRPHLVAALAELRKVTFESGNGPLNSAVDAAVDATHHAIALLDMQDAQTAERLKRLNAEAAERG